MPPFWERVSPIAIVAEGLHANIFASYTFADCSRFFARRRL
jgi:hypothetical protein